MALGLLTFSGCIGYIAYMKQQYKNAKVVTALNDQDEIVLVKKKSQWDWKLFKIKANRLMLWSNIDWTYVNSVWQSSHK